MIVLETERLRLCHLTVTDAPFIFELLNEEAFLRNIGDKGVRNLDDARGYIFNGPATSYERHGFGLYRVELADTGTPVGICGLVKRDTLEDVDIGFAFLSRHWGHGYAAEAASAVKAEARDRVGLPRLVAITVPENQKSIRVLEKIGLRFERMIRLTEGSEELTFFVVEF